MMMLALIWHANSDAFGAFTFGNSESAVPGARPAAGSGAESSPLSVRWEAYETWYLMTRGI